MSTLNTLLSKIVQRTSGSSDLDTSTGRTAFAAAVSSDLSSVISQLNQVHYELVRNISSTVTLDGVDKGLSGNVIFSHIDATKANGTVYWDSVNARPKTLKETIDSLLSEISRLENEIARTFEVDPYDDSGLVSDIGVNSNDIDQLRKDAFGTNYTLSGTGAAKHSYSLAQALDAIGAFFGGFPGAGPSGYPASYPALTLEIDQTDVTGLSTTLTAIRTFTGMDDATDSTPDYSAYNTPVHVADGESLEEAVSNVDAAVGANDTEIAELQEAFNHQGTFIFNPGGDLSGSHNNVYETWATLVSDHNAYKVSNPFVVTTVLFVGDYTVNGNTNNLGSLTLEGVVVKSFHPEKTTYFLQHDSIGAANNVRFENLKIEFLTESIGTPFVGGDSLHFKDCEIEILTSGGGTDEPFILATAAPPISTLGIVFENCTLGPTAIPATSSLVSASPTSNTVKVILKDQTVLDDPRAIVGTDAGGGVLSVVYEMGCTLSHQTSFTGDLNRELVGASGDFIFAPGQETKNNKFSDWGDLWEVATSYEGTPTIYVDDSAGAAAIPAGTWNGLSTVRLWGLKPFSSVPFGHGADADLTELTANAGNVLFDLLHLKNLSITSDAIDKRFTALSNPSSIEVDNCILSATVGAEALIQGSTEALNIKVRSSALIGRIFKTTGVISAICSEHTTAGSNPTVFETSSNGWFTLDDSSNIPAQTTIPADTTWRLTHSNRIQTAVRTSDVTETGRAIALDNQLFVEVKPLVQALSPSYYKVRFVLRAEGNTATSNLGVRVGGTATIDAGESRGSLAFSPTALYSSAAVTETGATATITRDLGDKLRKFLIYEYVVLITGEGTLGLEWSSSATQTVTLRQGSYLEVVRLY